MRGKVGEVRSRKGADGVVNLGRREPHTIFPSSFTSNLRREKRGKETGFLASSVARRSGEKEEKQRQHWNRKTVKRRKQVIYYFEKVIAGDGDIKEKGLRAVTRQVSVLTPVSKIFC